MKNAIFLSLLLLGCSDQSELKKKIITFNFYNSSPTITTHTIDDQKDRLMVWSADFHNQPNESSLVLGEVHGSMFIIKAAEGIQDRLTSVEFDWDSANDFLVISGVHAYPTNRAETDTPIHRAVIGGTGKFIGAKDEITTSRLDSGWYRNEITLVD